MSETPSDDAPEQKEYSAEEGIEAVVSFLENLLKKQNYAAITVTGSNTDVGKTWIPAAIANELQSRGIEVATGLSKIDTLEHVCPIFNESPKGKVLIFHDQHPIPYHPDTEFIKQSQDKKVKTYAQAHGLPFDRINLRIFVFRPDKPFDHPQALQHADILINNQGAKNKPQTYQPNK